MLGVTPTSPPCADRGARGSRVAPNIGVGREFGDLCVSHGAGGLDLPSWSRGDDRLLVLARSMRDAGGRRDFRFSGEGGVSRRRPVIRSQLLATPSLSMTDLGCNYWCRDQSRLSAGM